MTTENIHYNRYLKALIRSPFLKDSTPESLKLLLSYMQEERWNAKNFKSSAEVSATFYFIVSGRLKVFKSNPGSGREHTVFVLSTGDVFDVLSLLDAEPHDVYWEALDVLKVLKISVPQMRLWINEYPISHKAILYYLGERMRQLMDVATDVTLHSTLVRLASLLLKNINGETRKLELINNLPNDEIAGLIGTTRAVVSRHIQELKRCGAISVSRKKINVKNLEVLFSIAEEKYIP
ncbi:MULTISPECIES: Crp/Fnr family transcriptional regulator [unclassified Polaribacter]|uniref:Crp/Fnr family transcriptional regulator n=1 Tax=unclassified Polaribacter TaxID=196858 RepID=UPI0011BF22A1|nr:MULTISPECIES: Crp/Fnr family transcriptional regulator [unclassified Polaribacter]TXD52108.1 Crp/Fnr family transcriptional regulator [Polaribacter sp. IC063]TXD59962.1 Crp/Fnr family transcriptional regulator [Polaribacter sp. IC066]